MKTKIFFATALLSLVILGCNSNNSVTVERVVTAPGKKVDVVLGKYHGDATVPNTINVYVVKHDGSVSEEDLMFSMSKYAKYDVHWIGGKNLIFRYDKARIYGFKNEWRSVNVDNSSYIVEIELQKSDNP